MVLEGEVLFRMLLLQAGVQELRSGYHKNIIGATNNGTFSKKKIPQRGFRVLGKL